MNSIMLPHDIIEPAAVGWWPLAPGWWMVIALLLLLAVFITRWYRRRARLLAPLKQALREHQQLQLQWQQQRQQQADARACCAALSALLKRVARHYYPQESVSALTGPQWLTFLARTNDSQNEQAFRALNQFYHANADTLEPPFAACLHWLHSQRKQAVTKQQLASGAADV